MSYYSSPYSSSYASSFLSPYSGSYSNPYYSPTGGSSYYMPSASSGSIIGPPPSSHRRRHGHHRRRSDSYGAPMPQFYGRTPVQHYYPQYHVPNTMSYNGSGMGPYSATAPVVIVHNSGRHRRHRSHSYC